MRRHGWRTCGWAVLLAAAACSGSDGGTSPPTLTSVTVAPASVTLASGAVQPFTATAGYSDGTTRAADVTWSASCGSITSSGSFTAGNTPGDCLVIASTQDGEHADTATVTVPAPPPPDLVAIEVSPATATVQTGQTQAFTALGRLSDNSTTAVAVSWSATGGSVTAGGVYTAGGTPGSYDVIAAEVGGAALADTATVTVTSSGPTLVAIVIAPDSVHLHARGATTLTAVGRMSDNSTVSVPVTWSTTAPATAGTVDANGVFSAKDPVGAWKVIATQQGGTLADTIPIVVFETSGVTVSGPTFWLPVAPGGPTVGTAAVHLCTSNHFTDDPAGLGGTATVTATPDVGVVAPSLAYTTKPPVIYADGSAGVAVDCQKVWEAPADLVGTVTVTISVASNRPGSGMAKVFTYASDRAGGPPAGRADYSKEQDFTPAMTGNVVTESYVVSAGVGANIWFKNSRLP